jgi:hypothetical protein
MIILGLENGDCGRENQLRWLCDTAKVGTNFADNKRQSLGRHSSLSG